MHLDVCRAVLLVLVLSSTCDAGQSKLANIQVQAGRTFLYQVSSDVLQPSKSSSDVNYSIISTDGSPLPAWVAFNGSDRTLSGQPPTGRDLTLNWTLSASDGPDTTAADTFLFISAAPCPSGLYRHFRIRITVTDNASEDAGPSVDKAALCTASWELSSAAKPAFPSAGQPVYNISGNDQSSAHVSSSPLRAFQQLSGEACTSSSAWLGHPGDSIALDLGYGGCEAWPARLLLSAPMAGAHMPSSFTADASGAALQPGAASPDWTNLLTVQDFQPAYPSGEPCTEGATQPGCGTFTYAFSIAQPAVQSNAPPRALSAIPDTVVEIGSPNDTLIDVSSVFGGDSRVCCLELTLSIVASTPYPGSFLAPALAPDPLAQLPSYMPLLPINVAHEPFPDASPHSDALPLGSSPADSPSNPAWSAVGSYDEPQLAPSPANQISASLLPIPSSQLPNTDANVPLAPAPAYVQAPSLPSSAPGSSLPPDMSWAASTSPLSLPPSPMPYYPDSLVLQGSLGAAPPAPFSQPLLQLSPELTPLESFSAPTSSPTAPSMSFPPHLSWSLPGDSAPALAPASSPSTFLPLFSHAPLLSPFSEDLHPHLATLPPHPGPGPAPGEGIATSPSRSTTAQGPFPHGSSAAPSVSTHEIAPALLQPEIPYPSPPVADLAPAPFADSIVPLHRPQPAAPYEAPLSRFTDGTPALHVPPAAFSPTLPYSTTSAPSPIWPGALSTDVLPSMAPLLYAPSAAQAPAPIAAASSPSLMPMTPSHQLTPADAPPLLHIPAASAPLPADEAPPGADLPAVPALLEPTLLPTPAASHCPNCITALPEVHAPVHHAHATPRDSHASLSPLPTLNADPPPPVTLMPAMQPTWVPQPSDLPLPPVMTLSGFTTPGPVPEPMPAVSTVFPISAQQYAPAPSLTFTETPELLPPFESQQAVMLPFARLPQPAAPLIDTVHPFPAPDDAPTSSRPAVMQPAMLPLMPMNAPSPLIDAPLKFGIPVPFDLSALPFPDQPAVSASAPYITVQPSVLEPPTSIPGHGAYMPNMAPHPVPVDVPIASGPAAAPYITGTPYVYDPPASIPGHAAHIPTTAPHSVHVEVPVIPATVSNAPHGLPLSFAPDMPLPLATNDPLIPSSSQANAADSVIFDAAPVSGPASDPRQLMHSPMPYLAPAAVAPSGPSQAVAVSASAAESPAFPRLMPSHPRSSLTPASAPQPPSPSLYAAIPAVSAANPTAIGTPLAPLHASSTSPGSDAIPADYDFPSKLPPSDDPFNLSPPDSLYTLPGQLTPASLDHDPAPLPISAPAPGHLHSPLSSAMPNIFMNAPHSAHPSQSLTAVQTGTDRLEQMSTNAVPVQLPSYLPSPLKQLPPVASYGMSPFDPAFASLAPHLHDATGLMLAPQPMERAATVPYLQSVPLSEHPLYSLSPAPALQPSPPPSYAATPTLADADKPVAISTPSAPSYGSLPSPVSNVIPADNGFPSMLPLQDEALIMSPPDSQYILPAWFTPASLDHDPAPMPITAPAHGYLSSPPSSGMPNIFMDTPHSAQPSRGLTAVHANTDSLDRASVNTVPVQLPSSLELPLAAPHGMSPLDPAFSGLAQHLHDSIEFMPAQPMERVANVPNLQALPLHEHLSRSSEGPSISTFIGPATLEPQFYELDARAAGSFPAPASSFLPALYFPPSLPDQHQQAPLEGGSFGFPASQRMTLPSIPSSSIPAYSTTSTSYSNVPASNFLPAVAPLVFIADIPLPHGHDIPAAISPMQPSQQVWPGPHPSPHPYAPSPAPGEHFPQGIPSMHFGKDSISLSTGRSAFSVPDLIFPAPLHSESVSPSSPHLAPDPYNALLSPDSPSHSQWAALDVAPDPDISSSPAIKAPASLTPPLDLAPQSELDDAMSAASPSLWPPQTPWLGVPNPALLPRLNLQDHSPIADVLSVSAGPPALDTKGYAPSPAYLLADHNPWPANDNTPANPAPSQDLQYVSNGLPKLVSFPQAQVPHPTSAPASAPTSSLPLWTYDSYFDLPVPASPRSAPSAASAFWSYGQATPASSSPSQAIWAGMPSPNALPDPYAPIGLPSSVAESPNMPDLASAAQSGPAPTLPTSTSASFADIPIAASSDPEVAFNPGSHGQAALVSSSPYQPIQASWAGMPNLIAVSNPYMPDINLDASVDPPPALFSPSMVNQHHMPLTASSGSLAPTLDPGTPSPGTLPEPMPWIAADLALIPSSSPPESSLLLPYVPGYPRPASGHPGSINPSMDITHPTSLPLTIPDLPTSSLGSPSMASPAPSSWYNVQSAASPSSRRLLLDQALPTDLSAPQTSVALAPPQSSDTIAGSHQQLSQPSSLPAWLSLTFGVMPDASTDHYTALHYVNISRSVPSSAAGTYLLQLSARLPDSNATAVSQFRLSIIPASNKGLAATTPEVAREPLFPRVVQAPSFADVPSILPVEPGGSPAGAYTAPAHPGVYLRDHWMPAMQPQQALSPVAAVPPLATPISFPVPSTAKPAAATTQLHFNSPHNAPAQSTPPPQALATLNPPLSDLPSASPARPLLMPASAQPGMPAPQPLAVPASLRSQMETHLLPTPLPQPMPSSIQLPPRPESASIVQAGKQQLQLSHAPSTAPLPNDSSGRFYVNPTLVPPFLPPASGAPPALTTPVPSRQPQQPDPQSPIPAPPAEVSDSPPPALPMPAPLPKAPPSPQPPPALAAQTPLPAQLRPPAPTAARSPIPTSPPEAPARTSSPLPAPSPVTAPPSQHSSSPVTLATLPPPPAPPSATAPPPNGSALLPSPLPSPAAQSPIAAVVSPPPPPPAPSLPPPQAAGQLPASSPSPAQGRPPQPPSSSPSPAPGRSPPPPSSSPSPAPGSPPPPSGPSPPPPSVVQVPITPTPGVSRPVLEAKYRLQGQGLWPFATLQQQILRASVADVSGTGITNDDITFISASLESTQARRHRRALLQGTLQALNVTFQIQTNGTQAAKAIADQLYAATKSGVLAQALAVHAAISLPNSTWDPIAQLISLAATTSTEPPASGPTASAPAPGSSTPVSSACNKTFGTFCLDNTPGLTRQAVIGIIAGGIAFLVLGVISICSIAICLDRVMVRVAPTAGEPQYGGVQMVRVARNG